MIRRPVKVFFTLCFFILSVVASAATQAPRPTEFHIPFDFSVQGRILPAGTYRVERLDNGKPEILLMKSSKGRMMRIFITQRVEDDDYKEVALLVFNRYGDEYILSQVWNAGERSGQQVTGRFSKERRSSKPATVLVKGALMKSQ